MHKYDELYDIKGQLIDELVDESKKEGHIQNMDILAHTIKNICKIITMCEEEENGYSGRPYYRNMNTGWSGGDMTYDTSYSQARGRGRNANRDSMGRYSSHEGGTIPELYSIMANARSDEERSMIQDLINRMPK